MLIDLLLKAQGQSLEEQRQSWDACLGGGGQHPKVSAPPTPAPALRPVLLQMLADSRGRGCSRPSSPGSEPWETAIHHLRLRNRPTREIAPVMFSLAQWHPAMVAPVPNPQPLPHSQWGPGAPRSPVTAARSEHRAWFGQRAHFIRSWTGSWGGGEKRPARWGSGQGSAGARAWGSIAASPGAHGAWLASAE